MTEKIRTAYLTEMLFSRWFIPLLSFLLLYQLLAYNLAIDELFSLLLASVVAVSLFLAIHAYLRNIAENARSKEHLIITAWESRGDWWASFATVREIISRPHSYPRFLCKFEQICDIMLDANPTEICVLKPTYIVYRNRFVEAPASPIVLERIGIFEDKPLYHVKMSDKQFGELGE